VPTVQKTDKQQNRDRVIKRLYNRLISLSILCVVACLAFSLAACSSDSSEALPQNLSEQELAPEDLTSAELTEDQITENSSTEVETPVQTTGDQTATTPPTNIATVTDDHSNSDQSTIHFTDSNADIWPPQPVNITDVTTLHSVTIAKTNLEKAAKSTKALLADTGVSKSLGQHFEVLTQNEIKNKSDVSTHIETEVYSYNTNQVITIKFSADSNTILDHTAAAAHKYQPPESQAEVRQAIALAEDALYKQGFTDHLKLRGTGLLAYPSAIETAETGHQFFNDRKIYVTFGSGNGALPQYRALVNLSNSTVENSGAIQ